MMSLFLYLQSEPVVSPGPNTSRPPRLAAQDLSRLSETVVSRMYSYAQMFIAGLNLDGFCKFCLRS